VHSQSKTLLEVARDEDQLCHHGREKQQEPAKEEREENGANLRCHVESRCLTDRA